MRLQNNILYGPPGPEVPDLSLGQHIYQHLRTYAKNTFQVDILTGKHYKYKEILEKSVTLAAALKSYDVNVEDRVSIASENHPNYVITMCSTFFIGASFAPLNPAYTEREYRHMLDILQPRVMFVTHRTEKLMSKIASTLDWPMKLIQLEDNALDGNMITLNELLEQHKNTVNPYAFEPVAVGDNRKRVAAILGSSGTTGFPKGVMLSHRNMMCLLYRGGTPEFVDLKQGDRVLVFLPMFHGYAFGMVNLAITYGASIYMMRNFDQNVFLKSIEYYKITHLPLVPPILILLAKHPMVPNYDFSSVREVMSGASPLQKSVADEVKRRTKVKYIRNGYGMTELTIISNMSDRSSTDVPLSLVFPQFQTKVVDPKTGRTLPPNEVGEICFKGDQVMLGYFRNPKVTAETIDQDNWLHTGDLGYLNEKGVLNITGRIKELIKYKGFQVSPAEIEAVILSHPGVKEAAVVGKPDEVSGELPFAFIVKQPGSIVTAKEILDFTNKNLSPQKRLRGGVQFIEAIPKTPSGKILRRLLVNMISKL